MRQSLCVSALEMAAWRIEPLLAAAGIRTARADHDEYATALLRLSEGLFCALAPVTGTTVLDRVPAAIPRRALSSPPPGYNGQSPVARLLAVDPAEPDDHRTIEAYFVVLDSEVL